MYTESVSLPWSEHEDDGWYMDLYEKCGYGREITDPVHIRIRNKFQYFSLL